MKCLTPNCKSVDTYARGLCRKCYDRLARRVHRKTIKWGELIDQGLATKATNRGYLGKKPKVSEEDRMFLLVVKMWKERHMDPSSAYYDPDGVNPKYQKVRDYLEATNDSR